MKVELNGTWPLFGQFFNLAHGKSGAASYMVNLAPFFNNKNSQIEAPALPESLKAPIEELDKLDLNLSDNVEIRGIIIHKTIALSKLKESRGTLLEFLVLLLNNNIYPKTDVEHIELALVEVCFGLGKVIFNGETLSTKEGFAKILITEFPGATKSELEILLAKDASHIVPLFLWTYKLPVFLSSI